MSESGSATFRFEEDGHKYFLGDQQLPSVTQILEAVGIINKRFYAPGSDLRGRYIHKMTELDDTGELAEENVKDDLRGYLEAWRKWKTDHTAKILDSEYRVYHKFYGYAGTIDKIADDGCLCIVDIKSGQPEKWHVLQLTAYFQCFLNMPNEKRWKDKDVHLLNVYLRESGGYKTVAVEADSNMWEACLKIWKWIHT